MSESTQPIQLTFDDPDAFQRLCGANDEHLRIAGRRARVEVQARGNTLTLRGEPHDAELVADTLTQLYELVRDGHPVYPPDIRRSVDIVAGGGRLAEVFLDTVLVASGKRRIAPKNLAQKHYIDAIRRHDLSFGIGPAGTGKTYLAMALAVSGLVAGDVKRIVLTRPAVEAGERLGFLPGDMAEKVNPYLRPLYDALYDMLDLRRVQDLMTDGVIEVAPLAFMRGRTLNDCFVILDEAQNATREQMRMFLTRLGFGARAVVTGDVTQTDLPDRERSGLEHARRILDGVEGIAMCEFTAEDVVRHPLVARIIRAYEQDDARAPRPIPLRVGGELVPEGGVDGGA
ncbi:MAG: PhoH family protein [Deltaproteobacteria bacterium]|nr:PhoH family protein [Deltaproteobacteria bacterium]MCB9789163.1 PhoH family protein [Deltaproteobacteria bacterium]